MTRKSSLLLNNNLKTYAGIQRDSWMNEILTDNRSNNTGFGFEPRDSRLQALEFQFACCPAFSITVYVDSPEHPDPAIVRLVVYPKFTRQPTTVVGPHQRNQIDSSHNPNMLDRPVSPTQFSKHTVCLMWCHQSPDSHLFLNYWFTSCHNILLSGGKRLNSRM